MSEMIGKIAKAIADELVRQEYGEGTESILPHDLKWDYIDQTDVDFAAIVRAALEAMREPTADMVDAARDVGPAAPYGLAETREKWQAFIDAALKD